jgi:hypothetical protein
VSTNSPPPNKSLDASGGSVFRNLLGAAKGALIRAAASTQTFDFFFDCMKLPLIHRAVGLVILAGFLCTNASASQFTRRDKSQIIRFILRTHDFRQSETWRDTGDNTILLLDENISLSDIPSRSGVRFRLVKQAELPQLRSARVEYYELRSFERTKIGVRTSLLRTYRSPKEGNGSVVVYTCRKVGGRWKLKRRGGGAYAS